MAMASLQLSWLSSLNTISFTKHTLFPTSNLNKPHSSMPFKLSFSLNPSNAESSQPTSPETTTPQVNPVKLALENARAYKKTVEMNKKLKIEKSPSTDIDGTAGSSGSGSGSNGANDKTKELPAAVKIAMEKAKEYKQKKGIVIAPETGFEGNLGNETVEKKAKLSVSSMDFVGLGFADKEGRALPAGLVPIADNFPQGNLLEVEIIVGDSSNFGAVTSKPEQAQGQDILAQISLQQSRFHSSQIRDGKLNLKKKRGDKKGGKGLKICFFLMIWRRFEV